MNNEKLSNEAKTPALNKGAVSHSKFYKVKEKDFYCRQRTCMHYNGIGKNGNVLCSVENPDTFIHEDGRHCCNSYCG